MNGGGHELEELAGQLYAAGKNEELLALAKKSWPTNSAAPLPDGVAELCRLAKLAAVRRWEAARGGGPGPEDARLQMVVWEAHGLTAAVLSDSTHVMAGLLLPRFFDLCGKGAFSAAREVLDDMLRLVHDGSDQRPSAEYTRRLCSEKRAYSYFAEGRFSDAVTSYHEASAYTTQDPRAALKVEGGLALAEFMASDRRIDDVKKLRGTLEKVAAAANTGSFPDVAVCATRNLEKIVAGATGTLVPFELT